MKEKNLIIAEYLMSLENMGAVDVSMSEYMELDGNVEDLIQLFRAYLGKNREVFDKEKVFSLCTIVAEGIPSLGAEDVMYKKYKLYYDYCHMYGMQSEVETIITELKSNMVGNKYDKEVAYMELPLAINEFNMVKIRELYNIINK